MCRRTDRPGSCTSTKTSSSAYFCPVIELSGIIIQSLWMNVLEFALEKHADITGNQIHWEESSVSQMFPKYLPVHNHTRCVHMRGTVVRRRSQTREWTPRSDVKTFSSVLKWANAEGSSGFCNCFSGSLNEMCKMNTELRLWLDWLVKSWSLFLRNSHMKG